MYFEVILYGNELYAYLDKCWVSAEEAEKILAENGFSTEDENLKIVKAEDVWNLAKRIESILDTKFIDELMNDYGCTQEELAWHIADEVLTYCTSTVLED